MKLLVINKMLEGRHFDRIRKAAGELGLAVSFYADEADIPQEDRDAEIIYGFAPEITRTSRNLKWLCVPWAGVDSLMVPGYFANEDCLLSNSAGGALPSMKPRSRKALKAGILRGRPWTCSGPSRCRQTAPSGKRRTC